MSSTDLKTQEAFLNDVANRSKMYVYRSLEPYFDPTVAFIQKTSGVGPTNWHIAANKEGLQHILTGLSTAIANYSVTDGDFRTYLLLKMTELVYTEYQAELFSAFIASAYGVKPESVVGNLESSYSTQPPQNTQFPGLSTESNPMAPLPQSLVPNVLYNTTIL
jgi:hypothetical protein